MQVQQNKGKSRFIPLRVGEVGGRLLQGIFARNYKAAIPAVAETAGVSPPVASDRAAK